MRLWRWLSYALVEIVDSGDLDVRPHGDGILVTGPALCPAGLQIAVTFARFEAFEKRLREQDPETPFSFKHADGWTMIAPRYLWLLRRKALAAMSARRLLEKTTSKA